MSAVDQDGTYPRPMLVRSEWQSLDGPWAFTADEGDVGRRERWWEPEAGGRFDREITVPFPPESRASGVGGGPTSAVLWYRRSVRLVPDTERRTLLHIGAADQEAEVWVDGRHVGGHVGGQVGFTVDVTDALELADDHLIVVRTRDDARDADLPRGKQEWRGEPHGIWYPPTSGIWRTVWIERVPLRHVESLHWSSDLARCTATAEVRLAGPVYAPLALRIVLALGDRTLADLTVAVDRRSATVPIDLPALRHGQERRDLLWSPEHPALVSARVVLLSDGAVVDEVDSYLGLRTVSAGRGAFLLNGQPYFVRSVLEQGYWPDSHLTPLSPEALRDEVQVIRDLGFNACRIHQKVEDPRFLYWADRLGLLVSAETAAAYAFSPRAVEALTREWVEIVQAQRSHPSIAFWVPFNESWGVDDVAASDAQSQFVLALTALTRALDPTRPVVSNDGWEHVDSDVLAVHDYETDPARLAAHYADRAAVDRLRTTTGPAGLRLDATGAETGIRPGAPLMITEFGGVAYAGEGTWGYAVVRSDDEFATRVGALFDAIRAGPDIAGYCYTQLTDTEQESNGLLTADRRPKLPMEELRSIVLGDGPPGR